MEGGLVHVEFSSIFLFISVLSRVLVNVAHDEVKHIRTSTLGKNSGREGLNHEHIHCSVPLVLLGSCLSFHQKCW